MNKLMLVTMSFLVAGLNAQASVEEATWCKNKLAGGYINDTEYHSVYICRAQNPSETYQNLCVATSTVTTEKGSSHHYSALQYDSADSYSKGWLTLVATDDQGRVVTDGDVETGEESLRFEAIQGGYPASAHQSISEVVMNLNTQEVVMSTYEKQFLGRRLLGSSDYSCTRY